MIGLVRAEAIVLLLVVLGSLAPSSSSPQIVFPEEQYPAGQLPPSVAGNPEQSDIPNHSSVNIPNLNPGGHITAPKSGNGASAHGSRQGEEHVSGGVHVQNAPFGEGHDGPSIIFFPREEVLPKVS